MTLPIKLILLLCLAGCFPPCQMAMVSSDNFDLQVTYVKDYNYYLPLTLFHDGKSLIVYNGGIWHSELFTFFDFRLKGDTFYGYGPYPDNHQRTVYRSLPRLDEGEDATKLPYIVTNNPSPDFMADVRYRQYTLAEQDKVPKVYRDYIRRRVCTDGLDHTPIIIKEIWEFDFDGDGQNEAFIVANNSAVHDGYQEQPKPEPTYVVSEPETLAAEDGVGFYSYNLFYSETFLPIDFETTSSAIGSAFLSDPAKKAWTPFYEYNKAGQVCLFNTWWDEDDLFLDDAAAPPSSFDTAICDLNGDGLYDFFILNYTGTYAPYQIYIQHPDGYFFRLGGVYTPA